MCELLQRPLTLHVPTPPLTCRPPWPYYASRPASTRTRHPTRYRAPQSAPRSALRAAAARGRGGPSAAPWWRPCHHSDSGHPCARPAGSVGGIGSRPSSRHARFPKSRAYVLLRSFHSSTKERGTGRDSLQITGLSIG